MSINDVLQPNASSADSRLTFQHFKTPDAGTMLLAPHNSDARQGVDHYDWPPPLLFDVAYGCAALKTWGVSQFVKLARKHTRDIYYDDDGDDNENGDGGDDGSDGSDREPHVDVLGVDQKPPQQQLNCDVQVADRQGRKKQEAQAADSQTPDFADIILGLWMHNARKGQCQAHAMKAEKTQEKVRTWLDSTKD
jgi:hypothetical protein